MLLRLNSHRVFKNSRVIIKHTRLTAATIILSPTAIYYPAPFTKITNDILQIFRMYFQSLILALTYLLFFLAALGLRCCVQVFSICREQRLLSSCSTRAYCGGFSCSRAQALGHMVFSSCSTRAQQLQPVVSRAWGSIAVHTGPAAPQHVGSFWT